MTDREETVEAVFDTVADVAPRVRDGLPGRRLAEAGRNPSGETRKAADVHADELLLEALSGIDGVGEYASEERESTVDVGSGVSVAVDPLDGSSNLVSNNAMGTVVAIYDSALPASGESLVASGFVLYGPITTMTVARDGAVTEYVVEEDGPTPVREGLTLPEEPTVYGFGGRVPDWPEKFAAYVGDVESDESLKLRYGGAMIADVNQVLTHGGIFAYPALNSAPDGKLRLMFEGVPIAYVVECAGGRSSDGEQSLLEVSAVDLHQRVPVHVGNVELVEDLEAALA